ncbi:hypothetical protein GGI20_003271 [Coemansia sp. BCRC 34301]|nr:hypothetical protein GGI20_003271 [Coemansia sp. BCRC 34301]
MRPLSEQVSSRCESQLRCLNHTTRRIRSVCRSYQEPHLLGNGFADASIDYDELRETVKSAWRKRDPLEQLRIIMFVVPKGETLPSDYASLAHNNYKELMRDVCFDTNHCVFYELEFGYSSSQSDSDDSCSLSSDSAGDLSPNAVFNEFIVTSSPTKPNNISCPVRLNSIVFV